MPEHLGVFRITPAAHVGDGAWQGRMIWKELLIVAPAACAAIREADRHSARAKGAGPARSQDSQQVRPGCGDQKLYRVDRAGLPVTGPAGAAVIEEML